MWIVMFHFQEISPGLVETDFVPRFAGSDAANKIFSSFKVRVNQNSLFRK